MGVTEGKIRLFFESRKPSAIFFRYSLFAGFLMLMAGIMMNIFSFLARKEYGLIKFQKKIRIMEHHGYS